MNRTTRSAEHASLRTGIFATLHGVITGAGRSGEPSHGIGVGARTPCLRVRVLTVVAAAAFLALGVGSASASTHTFRGNFGSETAVPPFPADPYPLSGPSAVAIDNSAGPSAGDSYVADPPNHLIEKFDPAGNLIWIAGKGVDKTTGADLCTISSGDECQPGTSAATPGAFEAPSFLAVDNSSGPSAGDVYVADTAAKLVTKLAPDGSAVKGWGKAGSSPAPRRPGPAPSPKARPK